MSTTDILIIGAGATGLMAARALGRAGKRVTILEARDRPGGRINTIHDSAFAMPVESGAEFVHGDLDLTLRLLRKAAIKYYPMSGGFWRAVDGKLEKQKELLPGEKEFVKQLKELKTDMSVQDFLNTYFAGGEYEEMRQSVISFVQGYDAADAAHASCFSLLHELLGETSGEQYRIKGGYRRLVDFLIAECSSAGCTIELSTVATVIRWDRGNVTVTADNGKIYSADQAIITLPLSVLQAGPGQRAHVSINPLPPETHNAIHQLGITGVIKVVLQFDTAFWKDEQINRTGKKHADIGFIFSEAPIPTWWTQLPEDNAMITGWLAGPAALLWKQLPDKEVLQQALQSLSQIFAIDITTLEKLLVKYHVGNWTADEFSLGAYGYEKVESLHAKRILNAPLQNTLFFAGEALHEGPEHGTVEAALRSGAHVASLITGIEIEEESTD